MTTYKNSGFKETDYFYLYKETIDVTSDQLDKIKNTLLKRRFSFSVPIKYFNALSNEIEYDLLFITCGIQNPTNDQRSIRLFLKDQSIFGEPIVELMKQSKSFNKTLHCINHTFLNIKTYELMTTLNDETQYNDFNDLLNAYDLEFKKSLTSHCDVYKLNNKMIIMLNDCLDLTDEIKETNKFITLLNNNDNAEEDELLDYLHESIYSGLVYHPIFFKHLPVSIDINEINNGMLLNHNSYSHDVIAQFINSNYIMSNYEFLIELYEKDMSNNTTLKFNHNNRYNNIQSQLLNFLIGRISDGKNSVTMQLFNFKAINY